MRRFCAGLVLLCAGFVWAGPPEGKPEPEPKSLGEVARRARQKRERQAASKSKPEAQEFTNDDLTQVKQANTSNLSLPAGTNSPAVPLPNMTSDTVRTDAQAVSVPLLEAAAQELEKAKSDLAGLEAAISEAKSVLNPFSTLYSNDPNRQSEANTKLQQLVPQADQLKAQVAQIEARIAEIKRKAQLDGLGSGALPQEPPTGSAAP